jgi:hypothetical protein|tara:strand:+ start:649 stop:1029 length:381 start_codon:yes stop_codon:yes gene_type:complete
MEPVLNEEDLKVIRLDNGEILFSKVVVSDKSKNSGYLELHWPMKVLVRYDEEQKSTHVALLKWLPFTDVTSVPLAARCIMSVSELGRDYKKFYIETIKESSTESMEEEMNKMSKILADFNPTGLMN